MLPYVLGCPSWSEPAWLGSLYPKGTAQAEFLPRYAQVFNGVEGNTTFYAPPSPETVLRWAQYMPEQFQFCAKFPQGISHAADLRVQLPAALDFIQLMAPLGQQIKPFWLQLPSRFGCGRLPELADFLTTLKAQDLALAVEVRNSVFFARGEEERALNRLLRDLEVERICLDSRGLFSCQSQDAAVLHAQSRKPRLPVRVAALTQRPQVRFIGHPILEANDSFLAPWVEKLAQWLEAGLCPHIYLHTPDNHQAPELAYRFHAQLQARLPGIPDLPPLADQASTQQGSLF